MLILYPRTCHSLFSHVRVAVLVGLFSFCYLGYSLVLLKKTYSNFTSLCLHNMQAFFLQRADVGRYNDVIYRYMMTKALVPLHHSFKPPLYYHSHNPFPPTTLCPPLCRLPRESWILHGGGSQDRHLWSSPALSGLHCLGFIVLRDVDNHNRRRAGEPQSSRERGNGEEHWGAAFV